MVTPIRPNIILQNREKLMMMMQNRPFVILFVLLAFIASSSVAQPPGVSPPGALTLPWYDRGPIVEGQNIRQPIIVRRGNTIYFQAVQIGRQFNPDDPRRAGRQVWYFDRQADWEVCNYRNAMMVAGPMVTQPLPWLAPMPPAQGEEPAAPALNPGPPASMTFVRNGKYFLAGGLNECLANAKVIVEVQD